MANSNTLGQVMQVGQEAQAQASGPGTVASLPNMTVDGLKQGMQLAQMQQQQESAKVALQKQQDDLDTGRFNSLVGMTRTYLGSSDGVKKLLGPQLQQRMDKMQIGNPDYIKSLDDPEMQAGVTHYLDALSSGKMPQNADTARQVLQVASDLGTQQQFLDMGTEARKATAQQALEGLKTASAQTIADKRDENAIKVANIRGNAEIAAARQKAAPGIAKAATKNYIDTQNALEQLRGNPAAQQAEKDIYAADKFKSLLPADMDKATPTQVSLAASEIAKIAQGGVPTESELQHIKPNSIPGKLASAAQLFMNKPIAANQGAFLKQYQDYANSLKGDAQKVITDRYGRVLNSRKKLLSGDEYNTLNDQYINRFLKPSEGAQAPAPSQTQAPQANALGGAVAALRAAGASDDVITQKLQARGQSPADIKKALGK